MFSQRPTSLQPYKESEGSPKDAEAPAARVDYAAGVIEDGERGGRAGSTKWCGCQNCSEMERDVDYLCCQECPAAVARAGIWPAFSSIKVLSLFASNTII